MTKTYRMSGVLVTLAEVEQAQELGVGLDTLRARFLAKWPKEKAINTPIRPNSPFTVKERLRAEKNGVSLSTLDTRYSRGWDKERAINTPVETERSYWLAVAIENGIKEKTFDGRVYGMGWTFEEAALTSLRSRERKNLA